jgi:hypothetical protein
MDMKKIIFTGGSDTGLSKLAEYAKKLDYVSVHKIETELPQCTEIEYVGMLFRNMQLAHISTLLVNNVSEETRRLFVEEICDQFKDLEVFRIWFNQYADECPNEYDIVIDPNTKHFEESLDMYFRRTG